MQYLFTVTAFYYDTPVFYKISQISQFEYYAEPTDRHMRAFRLKKFEGTWISEGGYTERLAQQIGKKIDELHGYAIRN